MEFSSKFSRFHPISVGLSEDDMLKWQADPEWNIKCQEYEALWAHFPELTMTIFATMTFDRYQTQAERNNRDNIQGKLIDPPPPVESSSSFSRSLSDALESFKSKRPTTQTGDLEWWDFEWKPNRSVSLQHSSRLRRYLRYVEQFVHFKYISF